MTDSKLAKQTALPRRQIYRTAELKADNLYVIDVPEKRTKAKKRRKAKKTK